jgi:DNA repair exonuclease SbcCD ATPase subunit
MKVVSFKSLSLLVAVVCSYVHGQEEGGGAECDCTSKIKEATESIIAERDMHHRDVQTLLGHRDELTKSRDELSTERDALIAERDNLVAVQQQLHKEVEHQRELAKNADNTQYLQEIEQLKADVAKGLEDREHFRQVAQENQHYMQEYKVRLATIRDKSAKLDLELETAYSKIRELEQATLVTKLKKELSAGYHSILQVLGKQKGTENDPQADL